MKDGVYACRFTALGRTRDGELEVRASLADGGDPVHQMRGQLSRAGSNILASFEVTWITRTVHPEQKAGPPYSIKMFGTGSHTDFSVIGLGPLGLIVELEGAWKNAFG